jgi:SAM-dependent methyltransferase
VSRPIRWDDLGSLRDRVERHGVRRAGFDASIARIHDDNLRRVREGDLDHLVFYGLQSTHFTTDPSIEPALSAKGLVETLTSLQRETFLKTGELDASHVAAPVRARLASLLRAVDAPAGDARLTYFRDIVKTLAPDRRGQETALVHEYFRVMRFIYSKEFVAQRSPQRADAVAELYRTRGLSTDTAIEAGFLVSVGLGVLKSLDPELRIRRTLIVGPGLDLAPRTGLLEAGPPESYQPWAVMDALCAVGLSRVGDLELVAADINPRVVEHLRGSRQAPPTLTLVSGIPESDTVTLSPEYREYFTHLARVVGQEQTDGRSSSATAGHLRKTVKILPDAARMLSAESLDVVTERFERTAFDLIVATNILPYFDDLELTFAIANIASMLAPGGVFLHNEARPSMPELTAAAGMTFEQARQAVIANVRGAPAPLVDSVWLHRKAAS